MTRLLIVYLMLWGSVAQAQSEILTLTQAIDSSNVRLDDVRGLNYSSGPLTASLVNLTDRALRLAVHLDTPLFFRNLGAGQNMIATSLLDRSGSALTDGVQTWVPIAPAERLPVYLIAYCADFDKPNPSPDDLLEIASLPPQVHRVARQIAAYEKLHPGAPSTIGAQLALWEAQGVPASEAMDRFPFTGEDLMHMRAILAIDP